MTLAITIKSRRCTLRKALRADGRLYGSNPRWQRADQYPEVGFSPAIAHSLLARFSVQMRSAQPSIPLARIHITVYGPSRRQTARLRSSTRPAVTHPAVQRCRPVGRDTRVYLESQDDHRMRLPAHMAHAVLEAYPDDKPVVSPDPGWRAS